LSLFRLKGDIRKRWADEGVVVGRSLFVFVSRLRKLLKNEPSIQIKNIHGAGYKLELVSHNFDYE